MQVTETSVLTSSAEVEKIAAEISDLVDRAGAIYNHEPGFLLPWLETAERLGQSLRCIALRDRERLVAFLPLCSKAQPKGLNAKRLAPPLIGSSPSFDLVLDPAYRNSDSFERVAAAIKKLPWSYMLLKDVLSASYLATEIVPRLTGPGFHADVGDPVRYLTVDGVAFSDEYWGKMKSRKRIELRRAFGKCDSVCDFVCFDKPEDAPRIFGLIRSTLHGSWKSSEYLASVFLPMLEIQFRKLCARGQARARFCMEGDRPIAFLIEFIDRDGTANAYFNAMDEERKSIYPGVAVVLVSILEHLDGTGKPYKLWTMRPYVKKLANDYENVVTVTVERTAWVHSFRVAFMRRLETFRNQPIDRREKEQTGRDDT